MSRPDLTIIILAHQFNAQLLLAIQSAQWVKEVIVVVGSAALKKKLATKITDDNVKVKVIEHREMDFAALRNQAAQLSTTEWTMFLDSDEIVPQALAAEIEESISDTGCDGFYVQRQDIFQNKILRHGEAGGMALLRLARTGQGTWQGRVHESWQVEGTLGFLPTPLLHFAHPDITQFVNKVALYSRLVAEERVQQGKTWSLIETLLYPSGKFMVNYFLKLGFLDGFAGLIYAMMMSLHSLAVRIFIYEYTQKK